MQEENCIFNAWPMTVHEHAKYLMIPLYLYLLWTEWRRSIAFINILRSNEMEI